MSAVHSIAPPGTTTQHKKPPTFFERLGNALVYVIAFPFIAAFLAMKSVFTKRREPHHSYYDRLPEQHIIDGQNGPANPNQPAIAVDGGSVASRTRNKKA
jgi:hypothetical protein